MSETKTAEKPKPETDHFIRARLIALAGEKMLKEGLFTNDKR